MQKVLVLSLFFSSLLFSKEIPQEIVDTGNKLSKELLAQLGSKLSHEIKKNGILSAAKFCNSNALTLTEEVNLRQVQGISVKRISLKERNSANIPKADEITVLESMQKMLEKRELPEYVIEKEGKTYKYYKPLVIKKEVCLKCHGDISTNSELDAFIKEAYPLDKAIGYKMGDIRGAILVEIKE
jgi:hypothetical protein